MWCLWRRTWRLGLPGSFTVNECQVLHVPNKSALTDTTFTWNHLILEISYILLNPCFLNKPKTDPPPRSSAEPPKPSANPSPSPKLIRGNPKSPRQRRSRHLPRLQLQCFGQHPGFNLLHARKWQPTRQPSGLHLQSVERIEVVGRCWDGF